MNEPQTNETEHWKVLVSFLDEIRKQKKITNLKVSELTGIAPSHTSTFFSCKYPPTLPTFIKIANAVGVNFFFEDKDSKTDLNQTMEDAMNTLGRRVERIQGN